MEKKETADLFWRIMIYKGMSTKAEGELMRKPVFIDGESYCKEQSKLLLLSSHKE